MEATNGNGQQEKERHMPNKISLFLSREVRLNVIYAKGAKGTKGTNGTKGTKGTNNAKGTKATKATKATKPEE
jgi:hypothetical protein